MNGSEGCVRGVGEGLDRGAVDDVGANGDRFAAGVSQRAGDPLGLGLGDIRHDDAHASRMCLAGQPLADAAAGPRDDGDPSVEFLHACASNMTVRWRECNRVAGAH